MDLSAGNEFSGLKILVIEDETLIGVALGSMLEELGCTVVGPASELADALAQAAQADIDAAILDLNLNGESALPVVELLQRRGIPLILSSGHDSPAGMERATLRKPYESTALQRILRQVLPTPR